MKLTNEQLKTVNDIEAKLNRGIELLDHELQMLLFLNLIEEEANEQQSK